MNEQEFKKRVRERWGHRSRKGRIWFGIFLLIIGGLLLARASGAIISPVWVFTWPMLLIGFGLLSGIRHNFRGIGWLIPIVIGGIFLMDKLPLDWQVRPYIWPAVLITLGLFVILRPKKNSRWLDGGDDNNEMYPKDTTVTEDTSHVESEKSNEGFAPHTRIKSKSEFEPHLKMKWEKAMNDGNDVIDVTAIFGGVKKNVLNKNFKGGDVTTFMGGAEINLMQADMNGKVMIDCFNMFGGTKLIVPGDWDVQSGVVTIFGGIEDKRPPVPHGSSGKVLYLDGTCIFGGIEIKSY